MANITYTNKVAGAGGITGQWRAVDANEVKTVVNGKADALGSVAAHSGTTWDGTPRYRLLNANLALTLATALRSGYMIFKQDATGGRTLSINGISVPVASGANAITIVSFTYNDQTTDYVLEYSTNVIGNLSGGDVTPPVVVGMVAVDATHISVSFDESVVAPDISGWSFKKNGTNNPIVGATSPTSTVWTFEVTNAMINTDTILGSYDSTTGATEDTTGNELVSFTDQAVTNSIGGGGYDTDAQAVITAIEATGPTLTTGEKDAIDGLVVDLKAAGLWTGMEGLYGYVGGTAAAHAINFKTPGTFNITWNGGIVHSATGVAFNGTTGYGDTGINDNTHLTLDDVVIGAYSRSNTNNGFAMGAHDSAGQSLYLADQNPIIVRLHTGADFSIAGTPTRLIVASRQTAAPKVGVYRDGTQLAVDSTSATGKSNGNIYLGAINAIVPAAPQGFSDKEYALHFIYDGGMTAANVTALTTAVNTFQTALSRNV